MSWFSYKNVWYHKHRDTNFCNSGSDLGKAPICIQHFFQVCSELQKDFFCPISSFLIKRCPNDIFPEIRQKIIHEIEQMLVFFKILFIWSWTMSKIICLFMQQLFENDQIFHQQLVHPKLSRYLHINQTVFIPTDQTISKFLKSHINLTRWAFQNL